MITYNTEQLDRLEPAYLANYGLTEAPFSNLHEDRFLYLDAERAQRLNLLQHMTQYSNLLLIVQGERGVGKTSLITRFMKNAAENWQLCEVTANTMMDAGQLLFQAAQGFGVQQLPQDSSELQEMLYARVATIHHNEKIPILVIDDAHELPKDALLTIFNLADAQVNNASLLRIILFAEPQIEKILGAKDVRALRERITHTMEIPPLDEDTTAEYLKHRMAVAGFNGGSPFTPKMVKRIFKASGGIPARINQLAHETLDKGDFERDEVEDIVVKAQPKRQHKPMVLATISLLVIVLVLVFQDRINQLFEDKPGKQQTIPLVEHSPEVQPQAQPAQPATAPVQPPAENSLQQKVITLQPTTEPAPTAAEPATPAPAAASATQTTPAAVAEPQAVVPTLQLHSIEPDPVPASTQAQTLTLSGEGFDAGSEVVVSWANKEKKLPAARVKILNDKQMQVQLTVGTRMDKWQIHVINGQGVKSNVLVFQIAAAAPVKDTVKDWALAQEPGTFTLQLFGSHDKQNALAFMQKHKLGEQANYFVSEHNGKDWYSVVYGVYPDQAAATAASKTLPASLKSIKPWVRRMDDIQASINASRKVAQTKPSRKPAALTTTAVPKARDATQFEAWIWSQDPRSFTLQLLGSRETDSVQKFLRKYSSLNGTAVYFHTRHATRDWYTVVYGVYPDKQQAQDAIKRLPPELQKASPWIRSFASIHAELDRTDN